MSATEAYRSFMEAEGRNPNTIRAYCSSGRKLLEYSGKRAETIVEQDVVDFLNSVDGLSSRARHNYALRSFFEYLKRPQVVRLRAQSPERSLDWWLKPEDISRMVQACYLPRDRAAIGLGYSCALRNGELASLSRSDIDREGLTLLVRSEKKRGRIRETRVPLYNSTLEPVDSYLAARKDQHEALFLNWNGNRLSPTGVNCVVRRALQRAGIEAPRGYRNLLRHARASHLRLQGVPLEDIRQLLRHERLETSLIYSHIGLGDLAKRIPEPVLPLAEVAPAA